MNLSNSTWSPFQSPEVREICANLTPAEHKRFINEARQRGTALGFWIVPPCVVAVAIALGLFSFSWQLRVVLLAVFAIYFATLGRSRYRAMRRRSLHLLCETEWARSQGYTPDRLRLMKFPWSD